MKKKSLFSMIVLILGLAFVFTGCGGNNEDTKYKINFYNDTVIYQTIETKGNELINMPQDPTKTNYNFGGWFIDKDIWQQPFSYNYLLTSPITSDLNVYAKWEKQQITISFNTMGGNEINAQSINIGELPTKPTTPTKNNFDFLGWYKDINCTEEYNFDVALTTDTTLYAKWEFIKGSDEELQGTQAEFKGFENKGNNIYSIKVSNNTPTLDLSDKVKINSTSKWQLCTDIQATQNIPSKVASLVIGDNSYYILVTDKNENVKLYTMQIRRRELYNITFNSFGGSTISNQTIEEDNKATTPTTPIKTGYTFKNWDFDFNTPITQNLTINASWEANNYSIIYHGNNGTTNTITQSATFDNNLTIKDKTTFNYTGYNFIKWNTKADGTGIDYNFNNTLKYTIDNDLNLYAIYDTINYSITYELDGGTNAQNPTNYNIESETITLNSPIKTGYNFIGWFTENSFTNKIEIIEKGSINNLTLYAKWEAKKFKVQLNLNGGECDKIFVNVTYDEPFTLPTPEKEDYIFKYWFVVDSLESTLNDGDSIDIDIWNYDNVYYLKACFESIYYSFSNGEIIGKSENLQEIKSLSIPNNINGEEVLSIGDYAFKNLTSLESITFPDTITYIGRDAFYECNALNKVIVKDIETWCKIEFENVASNPIVYAGNLYINGQLVTELTIPTSIDRIQNYAFYGCTSLINLTTEDSLKSIGVYAFHSCSNLTSVIISDSVELLGDRAFEYCSSLEYVKLGDLISEIDYCLFGNCNSIKEFEIPTNAVCDDGILSSCSNIQKIKLGNQKLYKLFSVTTQIDGWYKSWQSKESKFYYLPNSLSSIIINDDVTIINDGNFDNCLSILSLTIPSSVTSIGKYAFSGCSKIVELYNLSTLEIAIDSVKVIHKSTDIETIIKEDNNGFLYFYDNQDYYLLGYKGKSNHLILPEKIEGNDYQIFNFAFSCYSSLTSVIIPNFITKIPKCAFYWCSSLFNITFPKGLIEIENSAFSGCESLREIVFPSLVTNLGEYAFYNCPSLQSIVMPNSVLSIGRGAFSAGNQYIYKPVYYLGNSQEFEKITGDIDRSTIIYYIENEADVPNDGGNYWHYDADGITPIEWNVGA